MHSVLDTAYQYEVTGSGKFGYGIEGGWFHSFENPRLFHFIEASAAYRVFRGQADHQGTLFNTLESTDFASKNTYDVQMLVASARAVNVKQLGKFSFLTTALGANFNYKLSDSYKRSSEYPLDRENFIDDMTLQLHFQIGFGMRLSRQLLMIPTIETPFITAYPIEELSPAFPFFDARYQPIIIGLKFMILREDPANCNAPTHEGIPQ